MQHTSYLERRGEIETYFDRTAAQAWERLTSDAPVGRIRATVRAGRDRMRNTLLSWLPEDMSGQRLLDAGCGTGALAAEAARRGAHVVAIDLSPTLVQLAQERWQANFQDQVSGRIDFLSGDMLDAKLGRFDHMVAMDSLIHYDLPDLVQALETLSQRCEQSMAFTFAPHSALLAAMHRVGRWFPRSDRSPSLAPMRQEDLKSALTHKLGVTGWEEGETVRVASGFYTSQAWQWRRECA
ncbi:MAG: magnesium protoporphyrin O-methyltransferase [Pseudomonadota bacterium]|jgi:magnesium-protoporphyrin O-methyltransferase